MGNGLLREKNISSYYTKIFLLPRTFELTVGEARKIERIAEYICLFYAKYFLQFAITSAAPDNELHFFYLMRKFKSIDLESAEETIKSFERHLGYLSEELVVFSLFDNSVSYAEKTIMGQKLINLPRPKVFTPYKPKTPIIIWCDEEKPFLSSFIDENSWLLFHLLKLNRA